MTTVTLESRPLRRNGEQPPSLPRLTAVELRKMVDTRAGSWLLVGILVLSIAALVTMYFAGETQDHTFKNMFVAAALPSALLLPIVGILLVTSEWTQRTALITFALVPHRPRVLAAKGLAGVVLAGAAFAASLGLGAVGTAIAQPGIDGTWSLSVVLFGQVALYMAAAMLMGIGFGATLLTSAPAITLYFLMPIGMGAVGAIPWFDDIVPWLDWWNSVSILADKPLDAGEWARAGTSLAVWMVLPLLVGVRRVARGEVS
jgi:ABC-2 type transport system permease protein